MVWSEFDRFTLDKKVKELYEKGTFVMAIRYYRHKINLYLVGNFYVEVFYNPKKDIIEKVLPLDTAHTRMKFYYDQIKLPRLIFSE